MGTPVGEVYEHRWEKCMNSKRVYFERELGFELSW